MTMRIATWNVNSLAVRLPQVLDWLGAHQPDALCLQETKLTDDKFPQAALAEAGYAAQWFGQKTYNGVALLSRQPIEATKVDLAGDRRVLSQRAVGRQRQVSVQAGLAGCAADLDGR